MNKVLTGALYVFLVVIFIFSLYLVVPVYRKYKHAQKEVILRSQELDRSQAECLALREEVHDLEHHSSAVERVAREKFRYSREGEIIYLYTE